MKEFLLKHKKIILFGVILASVFSIIISMSSDRSVNPTRLTEFITRERNNGATSTFVTPIDSSPITIQPTTSTDDTAPKTYSDLTVNFIEGVGFTPGSKNANVGQKIIIKNGTLSQINVVELMPKTSALANGALIEPGASFEFVLVEDGLFTYRELNSQKTGRFWVGK